MRINLIVKLNAFRRNRRGNVAIVAALAMPVVMGSLGLGAEVASWYGGKRALQNAVDSAAIAAATTAGSGYGDEARAVARQYGFQNGVNGVTVTTTNTAPCPGGGANCFQVTVEKLQPLLLAQAVGFTGDGTLNGSPAKRISATAIAIQTNVPRQYCVLALAGSGASQGIRSNGAPFANLSGCNVMSNTAAVCNGHNLQADIGDAHTTNNGCGVQQNSGVPIVTDPYSGLASNIAPFACGVFHAAPTKKNDPPLPSSNMLHGSDSRTVINMCGDVELSGPVLINSGGNTVLTIWNGGLDLQGYTLQTQPGSKLTIIFTGSDNARLHAPTGNGTFDIQAPTSGPWSGVAMYQHPSLTGGVNISAAGNSPTWLITGLVYLPRADVTFSGAVNKSSNGASCFGLVVDKLTVNGTGSILSHGQCSQAGLVLPQSAAPGRGQLVS